MQACEILRPRASEVPVILSVPHCGTTFPPELIDQFNPDLVASLDDTDWFVHRLYSFAPSMGITLMHANYSRWVVDLNRDPYGKPLYTDGRIITTVCPATDFLGAPLYKDSRTAVEQGEIDRRLEKYFVPYHKQLTEEVDRIKTKFGKVLLWDCHSIRQTVKTIQQEKFPDLILGDADEKSASGELIKAALDVLASDKYKLQHNHPFKGGYITRHFGRPSTGVHGLQLEMTKVNYMDDAETSYDTARAGKMQDLLKKVFHRLLSILTQ